MVCTLFDLKAPAVRQKPPAVGQMLAEARTGVLPVAFASKKAKEKARGNKG
jgi:hypothetical protein